MKKSLLLLFVVSCSVYVLAQVPTIGSFTPLSGPVGTAVTISGTNFSTIPSDNLVYVGGVRATVNEPATTSILNITIPPGITFGPISVTVGGLTSFSLQPYLTTFEGGGVTLSSISFSTSSIFPTPSGYVSGTAMGDLNNDGKTDVVTANTGNGSGTTISVFTNNSTYLISFSSSRLDIATGSNPWAVVLFDVDGDGMLDIAVNNYVKISVLRNTSSGGVISFASQVDIAGGSTSLISADFDLDGKPDLAYPDFSASQKISVLRNTTSGTSISFTKTNYTSGNLTYGIKSGDYDGDGKVDIALLIADEGSPAVSILRNASTGTGVISFDTKLDLPTTPGPRAIASGDVDGDGKTDIGITNNNYINGVASYSSISIFRNLSTPGNLQFASKEDFDVTTTADNLSFNDVDGDGKIDVLMAQNNYGVLRNKSTPGVLAFDARVTFQATYSGTISLTSGDLNNDGRPDFLATNPGSQIAVGKNQINEPVINSFSPSKAGSGDNITVAGVNMDKVTAVNIAGAAATFKVTSPTQLQVTVGNGASGSINLISPYGTGSKSGFTFYNGPRLGGFIPDSGPVGTTVKMIGGHFSATPADNVVRFGSTRAEVVTASSSELLIKIPKGSVHKPVSVTVNKLTSYALPLKVINKSVSPLLSSSSFATKVDFPLTNNPETFVIGDFDDDGMSDVAVIQNNTVSVYRNTGIPGTFSFAPKVDLIPGSIPISITTADFDNDGKLDIAVANSGSASVSVFKNSSNTEMLSFEAKTDFAVGTNPQFITAGDLNGDGKTDIATANFTNSNLASVLLNATSTTISFATKVDYTAGSFPTSVAIADLNYDDQPELLVTNGVANTLSIFKNTSKSEVLSFDAPQSYPTGSFPVGISAVNYTSSVYPNLLVPNNSSSSISTFTISALTTVVNPNPITTGGSPTMIAMGDFNGDALIDLVSANKSESSVSVFQNTEGITFSTKIDLTAGGGPNAVAVVDLDGDGAQDIITANNSAASLSVFRNMISSLSSFSPLAAPAGSKVTITGSNLSSVTGVSFGGTAATSFTIVSSTTIEAIVGKGTSGTVAVTLPSGTISLSGFTYQVFNPLLQSFLPKTGTKGTVVTLAGINMNTVTNVKFGGTPAASFEIVSPTQIIAVVGEGSTGSVAVSTADGYVSSNSGFIYVPIPSIISFTPATASTGKNVTITGTDFSGVTAVSFGETPATSFTITSPASISAIVGAGSSGKVTLTFALGAVSLDGFTFEMITAVEPDVRSYLELFPNPNNGRAFTFRLPSEWEGETTHVEVRDLTGRLLTYKQTSYQTEITISLSESDPLQSGLYIVKFQAGNKKLFKKIVVQN